MIQSIASAVGWFHPLVWLASRQVTIESERCCDEETIAFLRCNPVTYARSLLDVLELKHLLRVAPALPGVRPVDITSSRLERIMRLGQGCRSRSPWWILSIALVSAVAVLPGAEYVTAQSPEPKKIDDSAVTPKMEPGMAPEASPLTPKVLPLPPLDPNDPFANQEDFVRMDAWIYEVASGAAEAKKLFKGIKEQSIKQQDRNIPILSTVPYLGRLFKTQGIQLVSATSGVERSQACLMLLPKEQYLQFVELQLNPANPILLTRPALIAASGIEANMEVGAFDPLTRIFEHGISLKMKPTIVENDTIRLVYELTRSKPVGPKDLDEQLSKDQSAKDLSRSIQKSTVQTSVQFRFDQTLVIASQQNFADRPYEIVVVKCSLPYAKQEPVNVTEQSK